MRMCMRLPRPCALLFQQLLLHLVVRGLQTRYLLLRVVKISFELMDLLLVLLLPPSWRCRGVPTRMHLYAAVGLPRCSTVRVIRVVLGTSHGRRG
jgi:hypothetical protein